MVGGAVAASESLKKALVSGHPSKAGGVFGELPPRCFEV